MSSLPGKGGGEAGGGADGGEGGEGGESGEGGEGGDEGGDDGGGGGAAPQLTAICATAASPSKSAPRLYSKTNAAEKTSTFTACQLLPWFPLRLQTVSPAASISLSSPMVAPHIW